MKIAELVKSCDLKPLSDMGDKDACGIYISDMLSDVMSSAAASNIWITTQTHKNVVSAANLIDIAAIVVPENREVPQGTVVLANRFGVIILSSPLPADALGKKLAEAGV
ncbi:MAG: serine kinase [Candidatus Eremiobacteraeota bacterium]|nr:serine kinase [Candidatus Eremiobacteraeota bacterium]